jgi:DNA-binding CsgD family transcriptional regulator
VDLVREHRSYEISIAPSKMGRLLAVHDERTRTWRAPVRAGTCWSVLAERTAPCPGCPLPGAGAAVLADESGAFRVVEVVPRGRRARVYRCELEDGVLGRLFNEKLRRFAARARLSTRELEVLRGMTERGDAEVTAARLGISVRTVRFHIRNVFRKTHTHSRHEVLLRLIGLVAVPEPDRRP